MKKVSSFRTKVFMWANELQAATGKSFPVCLATAWALYRLRRDMHQGVVKFAFEKADGSLRVAQGTLQDVEDKVKGTGTPNYKTFKYFDTEKESFRSFKIGSFITAY